MSNTDKDKIRNLIEKKIQVDTNRAKAEEFKLKLETDELIKKTNTPWFMRHNTPWIFKYVVTAGIVSPLLYFYVVPFQKAESVKRLHKFEEMNQRLQESLARRSSEAEMAIALYDELQQSRGKVEKDIEKLKKAHAGHKKIIKEIREKVNKLLKQNVYKEYNGPQNLNR